jgi:hypothetical protein
MTGPNARTDGLHFATGVVFSRRSEGQSEPDDPNQAEPTHRKESAA